MFLVIYLLIGSLVHFFLFDTIKKEVGEQETSIGFSVFLIMAWPLSLLIYFFNTPKD